MKDENEDIVMKLLYFPSPNNDVRRLMERAAGEIIQLRKALRPFAEWSNAISIKDIDEAKRMLENQQMTLLETMVQQARGGS